MGAFLITYKPETENRHRGWPIAELRRVIKTCQVQGWADEDWRFRATKRVKPGDRVFLLLQGKMGPAIIGYGEASGPPSKESAVPRIRVRFEKMVDPTIDSLVCREVLLEMAGATSLWRIESSGVSIAPEVAAKLENLVFNSEAT